MVEEAEVAQDSTTDVDQGAVVASDEIQVAQGVVVSEGDAIVMDQGEVSAGDLVVVVGSDQAETVTQDHLRRVHQEVMNDVRTLVVPAEVVVAVQAIALDQGEVMTVQEALKAADSKLKNIFFLSSLA